MIQTFEIELIDNKEISSTIKNTLLYNLCVYKMILQGFQEIIAFQVPSWDDLVDDCIRRRLREIFDNPVSTFFFLLNPPVNFASVVGACVWEVTYASNQK